MNFIKNIDRKLLKRFGIIIGIIVILFIILIIFLLISGSRLSYKDIESKMISAAKEYYSDNTKELPKTDNGVVSVSADKLAEGKYMKSLDKLVKNKSAICSGQVMVTKNGEHLLYSATLNCGENYETKKLKDLLVENVVESGNGIYKIGESYVFRGDNVNNYVSFADKLWRILRINPDGTIRMIETTKRDIVQWDNRYNSEKKDTVGINDYNVSRIKDYISETYDEFDESSKAYLMKYNLCIGKRSENETNNDGSIECSQTLENQDLGLILVNEYVLASLSDKCKAPEDRECTNYNYLSDFNSMWTLTADKNTSQKVYKISDEAFLTNAANYSQIKLVVHINSQVNYVAGDGTEENPYTFN